MSHITDLNNIVDDIKATKIIFDKLYKDFFNTSKPDNKPDNKPYYGPDPDDINGRTKKDVDKIIAEWKKYSGIIIPKENDTDDTKLKFAKFLLNKKYPELLNAINEWQGIPRKIINELTKEKENNDQYAVSLLTNGYRFFTNICDVNGVTYTGSKYAFKLVYYDPILTKVGDNLGNIFLFSSFVVLLLAIALPVN